jgi:hypothetical protein
MYDLLLNQINGLNKELEGEEHKSKKMLMQINSRLKNFTKANEKAFDRLKNEREATEKKLQEYLK